MNITNSVNKFFCCNKQMLITALFLFISHFLFSEEPFRIRGKVDAEHEYNKGTIVYIEKNFEFYKNVEVDENGNFDLTLPWEDEYRFHFKKEGFVTKVIMVSTYIPPYVVHRNKVPVDNIKITLFRNFEDMDTKVFEEVVASVEFDKEKRKFVFDHARDQELMARMRRELNKNYQLRGEYERLVAMGDAAFNSDDFEKAMELYKKALTILPNERYPLFKIEDAKTFQEIKNAGMNNNDDEGKYYEWAIKRADKAFYDEKYLQAKKEYEYALKIKSYEQYPKDQIKRINDIINYKPSEDEFKENRYKELVKQGDILFYSEKYINAKSSYKQALDIKPESNYPKDQIARIDKFLSMTGKKDVYFELITQADVLFNAKKYASSKEIYIEALEVKPDEVYPKEQITKINDILKEQLNQQYAKLIDQGDLLFNTQKYQPAKGSYQDALALKPNEAYPKSQIEKIDQLLAQSNKDQQYAKLIDQGDLLFNTQKYQPAKGSYQDALALKPNETYPKSQIEKIDQLLAQSNKDQQYAKLIDQGDLLFNTQKYQPAKGSYQDALALKPNETYPKSQIEKIDQLLAQSNKDQQYAKLIDQGDLLFNTQKYQPAKGSYQDALALKPNEAYPKSQIEKIDQLLAQSNKDQQYAKLIDQGDLLFNTKKYQPAKSSYQDASALKPNEAYPKSQIEKIDQLLAQSNNDQQYAKLIDQGDLLFNTQKYQPAKSSYQDALALKPNETYPKSQIEKIEAILKQLAVEQRQLEMVEQKYLNLIASGDESFEESKYEDAIGYYKEAISVKPEEIYPTIQINKIQEILRKQRSKNNTSPTQKEQQVIREKDFAFDESDSLSRIWAYKKSIQIGDEEFRSNRLTVARFFYNKALGIRPDDFLVKEKLSALDNYINQILQSINEDAYQEAIKKGDAAFKTKDYSIARYYYYNALKIRPESKEAQEKIKGVEQLMLEKMNE